MSGEKSQVWLPDYPNPKATVFNPLVPFWGSIPGGLKPGKIIEIRGYIPPGADVFEINIMTSRNGDSKKSERPLHISVRMNYKIVVLNSYHNGSWGTEEIKEMFPFQRDKHFLMLILVENHCYQIAVECEHRWTFNHRLPYPNPTLHISGCVHINEVHYREPPRSFNDSGDMPKCLTKNRILLMSSLNPSLPYFHSISEGVKAGLMIYISAYPLANAKNFTMNLSCNYEPLSTPEDIAFHFNPRFSSSEIVRNTCVKESWGREEKESPYFPFLRGIYFDMIICIEKDKFMVSLNGQHFLEYHHRIFPISRINMLCIFGDIYISSIKVTI